MISLWLDKLSSHCQYTILVTLQAVFLTRYYPCDLPICLLDKILSSSIWLDKLSLTIYYHCQLDFTLFIPFDNIYYRRSLFHFHRYSHNDMTFCASHRKYYIIFIVIRPIIRKIWQQTRVYLILERARDNNLRWQRTKPHPASHPWKIWKMTSCRIVTEKWDSAGLGDTDKCDEHAMWWIK
jgi:hypothetical protein